MFQNANSSVTYLVLRSWSRIFFSISASVSVSMNGDHCSASAWGRNGSSTEESGASLLYKRRKQCYIFQLDFCAINIFNLKAYVLWCQESWPRTLYAIAVTNSPPRPNSAQIFKATCSGLLFGSLRSHSSWSTKEILPTWMFSYNIY